MFFLFTTDKSKEKLLIVIWINWTISQIVIKIIIALLRLHDNKFSLMKILMKLSEETKEIYYLVLETFFISRNLNNSHSYLNEQEKTFLFHVQMESVAICVFLPWYHECQIWLNRGKMQETYSKFKKFFSSYLWIR